MASTAIVSNAVFNTVYRSVVVPANILTAVLGILSNIVNVVVFSKMTPRDTMTISLTALAVSDLLFSCLAMSHFIIGACIVSGIQVVWSVDLKSLQYIAFVWTRPVFHKTSIAITMFMSCERSFCVVKPFLVKQIFTNRRVTFIIVAIYCIVIALFLPVNVTGSLRRHERGNGTGSIFLPHLAPGRDIAEKLVLFSVGFPLVLISQVIIVISSVFMVVGLRRHQRFRKAASSTGHRAGNNVKVKKVESLKMTSTMGPFKHSLKTAGAGNTKKSDQYWSRDGESSNERNKIVRCSSEKPSTSHDKQTEDTLERETDRPTNQNQLSAATAHDSSTKEDRLIQTVLVLAVMNVVLNTPLLVFYTYYNMNPKFRPNEKFGNLHILTTDIAAFLQSLNTVLNLLVYFTLNTKFRALIKTLFSCHLA